MFYNSPWFKLFSVLTRVSARFFSRNRLMMFTLWEPSHAAVNNLHKCGYRLLDRKCSRQIDIIGVKTAADTLGVKVVVGPVYTVQLSDTYDCTFWCIRLTRRQRYIFQNEQSYTTIVSCNSDVYVKLKTASRTNLSKSLAEILHTLGWDSPSYRRYAI